MARSREEIGAMVAKALDRLDAISPNATIEDAMILIEVVDPDDPIEVEDERGVVTEVPATTVLKECTSQRVVVEAGLIDFASQLLYQGAEDD